VPWGGGGRGTSLKRRSQSVYRVRETRREFIGAPSADGKAGESERDGE